MQHSKKAKATCQTMEEMLKCLSHLKRKKYDLTMIQMVPSSLEEAWLNWLLLTLGFHLTKVTQF
jgi:hypothetical protein